MKKAELLRSLKEAMLGVEGATSAYLKHMIALISRSNLQPQEIEKIRKAMEHLIRSNQRQSAILMQLQQQIKEDERDDF